MYVLPSQPSLRECKEGLNRSLISLRAKSLILGFAVSSGSAVKSDDIVLSGFLQHIKCFCELERKVRDVGWDPGWLSHCNLFRTMSSDAPRRQVCMHGAIYHAFILHGNRHPFGSRPSQSVTVSIIKHNKSSQLFSELNKGAHAPFSSMITPPYGFLCSPLGQYTS